MNNFPMTRYGTTTTVLAGDEEELENNDGDLDALATAQEEAEALVSLATANRNTP